jgi:Cu/Ag efflux pump CusA
LSRRLSFNHGVEFRVAIRRTLFQSKSDKSVVGFFGCHVLEAASAVCRLRLRPILMTSFAFILGVLPLVSGSGSEMRQAVGVAVFFGMLGVTLLGLMFTPIFYMLVRNLADWSRRTNPAPAG